MCRFIGTRPGCSRASLKGLKLTKVHSLNASLSSGNDMLLGFHQWERFTSICSLKLGAKKKKKKEALCDVTSSGNTLSRSAGAPPCGRRANFHSRNMSPVPTICLRKEAERFFAGCIKQRVKYANEESESDLVHTMSLGVAPLETAVNNKKPRNGTIG